MICEALVTNIRCFQLDITLLYGQTEKTMVIGCCPFLGFGIVDGSTDKVFGCILIADKAADRNEIAFSS